ncbi:MAG TPA: hypothetical protein ENK46_09285, partial [Flavobacteriia bacterium]|nr:hypothetical protein [Flavobacteriia bacterium]
MFKKIILLFLLLSSIFTFSQEKIAAFKNYLKTSGSDLKDVIPIVNQENGDISLFLMDAKNVYGYLLKSAFEISKQMTSEDKSRKYKIIIGSSVSGNNYRIFLTTKKHDEF